MKRILSQLFWWGVAVGLGVVVVGAVVATAPVTTLIMVLGVTAIVQHSGKVMGGK